MESIDAAGELKGCGSSSKDCERFPPIFGTVTPDFTTSHEQPRSLVFLVRTCGGKASSDSSSDSDSGSDGTHSNSGRDGSRDDGDSRLGGAGECESESECEGLEAMVSDFCGSSWRAQLSRDDLEDEKDDLGINKTFAAFLAWIHETLSSRLVTVTPTLAKARATQVPQPAAHPLDTITLMGQKVKGAPRFSLQLKRVEWPGRADGRGSGGGGADGRGSGGGAGDWGTKEGGEGDVALPLMSESHSLQSHPLAAPKAAPVLPSSLSKACESVAAEIAFALMRDRRALVKKLIRERAKHERHLQEVEEERATVRSYGPLGPPKSKRARSRSASRMTSSHVAPAPPRSLSHSQSLSRSQGHAASQKHPPVTSGLASASESALASARNTAGTVIARLGSSQREQAQQPESTSQEPPLMSQEPPLLSHGVSQGWLLESQGTTEDAAQTPDSQSHWLLSQSDSQSQAFLSQSGTGIPHATSRSGRGVGGTGTAGGAVGAGGGAGGDGMLGDGGRVAELGRREATAGGGLVPASIVAGGSAGGAAGAAGESMARGSASLQRRQQQRRQPVPFSRRVKKRVLGTKLTTDGDDDDDNDEDAI
ncbi:hypothetical protein CLOM_g8890 [Closterium sp. NIES-68]|nr:hypothetical protein CLOM_g8890 [Closterium sp. NIES-68]GJP74952.1 hypothetical protein CLOP_g5460 [Closterium sp. NIES-67]